MNDNTKFPERRSAPGPLAQQKINRLTVDAHMMASTLASMAESLTEAQARNVQLAAALEMVQGECGLLMGKVAAREAWDSVRPVTSASPIDRGAIMEAVQEYASAWSLVGGRFDNGSMLEQAEAMIVGISNMLAADPQKPKLDWPEVSAAAQVANQSLGQWMPEQWVKAFVKAYNKE